MGLSLLVPAGFTFHLAAGFVFRFFVFWGGVW
jgi:hypothetical protein